VGVVGPQIQRQLSLSARWAVRPTGGLRRGAQRNASEFHFDGPRNLLNAVRICVDPQSRGRVLPNYGYEGGGKVLADAGAVMGDDLSPQKARILLMLLLQNGAKGQATLQAAFSH
jgi:L-asparaginase/Glu-tRNA(Gln) amidotransferase subunit D